MSGEPVKNKIQPGDGDPRHGTRNGYSNHGCRCAACTEAWRIAHWLYMQANPARLAQHALSSRLSRRAQRKAAK